MPYLAEKKKIAGGKYDRRIKIPATEHDRIKEKYKAGNSMRALAAEYGVHRRTIQFIIYPERSKQANANRDWRNYYDKEKHATYTRGHRRYKHSLSKKHKI